jgi:hypothetical protein
MQYKIQETNKYGGVGLPNFSPVFKAIGWQKGDVINIEIINRDEIKVNKCNITSR